MQRGRRMRRYIDAYKIPYHDLSDGKGLCQVAFLEDIVKVPTADVRENATAHKVVGGGEHDGATCWFECSQCHGTVDIDDAYCKHCGAQMER